MKTAEDAEEQGQAHNGESGRFDCNSREYPPKQSLDGAPSRVARRFR
jgi:hypothetical protein